VKLYYFAEDLSHRAKRLRLMYKIHC